MTGAALRAFASRQPAAFLTLLTACVGFFCLAVEPLTAFFSGWPAILTIPASDWVGAGATWFLEGVKPAARGFSYLLGFPMQWANALLVGAPWPLVIGAVTATGWYIGGLRMALLGLIGLSLVLASGYWVESMNTLALVSVSVPLALLLGGSIGILAYESPRIKRAVLTVLDVMQTVPTFAYLTPLVLLFGFGPVVGLIASAIYARRHGAQCAVGARTRRKRYQGSRRDERRHPISTALPGGDPGRHHTDHGGGQSMPDGGAVDGDHRGCDRRV